MLPLLQVSDLLERVDAQGKEDDAISRAVNDKVEEWTARVQERDRENAEQARIIADLRSKMTSAALGHDRVQIDKLTKVKLISSFSASCHEKATEAQYIGRRVRLAEELSLFPSFLVEFCS